MKLESYWLDTAPPFTAGARGAVQGRVDVAVIGAGFTGLSSALALSRRGASVAVLEGGRILGEASGRNGGQCNCGLPLDYAALMSRFGAARAAGYYRAYGTAVDTVERIVREEAIDCGFVRNGRLKLAAKPKHYEKLARACDVLRANVDTDVTLIAPERLREEVDSDAFHGGLLQPTSAQMHVGRFGVGLAAAAADSGAKIYENALVTRLERPNGKHRLTCARGVLEADQVLLATGAACIGPFNWFRRRMAPLGSFIIVTEPLELPLLERLLPKRRCYVTSKNVGNYFRITSDSRLLFGGRARFAMSNPPSDRKSGDVLRHSLSRVFPALQKVRIDYCWGGLVDFTADRLPRAGEHEGLFYSMGYSGHGVQMSVHMGQVMAEVLAGRSEANPWRDLDWPAIPGHLGKPWFLPLVGAYYRLKDLID
jgi:glycine/D-amino acid oxidase-like deaminating enzyme